MPTAFYLESDEADIVLSQVEKRPEWSRLSEDEKQNAYEFIFREDYASLPKPKKEALKINDFAVDMEAFISKMLRFV